MIKNQVIVGLDDSAASRAALRWAAAYAHTTGKDLRAVHVLDWPIGLNASALNRESGYAFQSRRSLSRTGEGYRASSTTPTLHPGRCSSSPKETSAISWCASAPWPTCSLWGPANQSEGTPI